MLRNIKSNSNNDNDDADDTKFSLQFKYKYQLKMANIIKLLIIKWSSKLSNTYMANSMLHRK